MKWFLIVLSVVSLVAGQNDTWPTIPPSTPPPGNDSADPSIVLGERAQPGEIPWQAAIYQHHPDGRVYGPCGGSLIHPLWVVTAAHCFIWPEARTEVRLGGTNVNTMPYNEFANYRIIHPEYTPFFNDITLLRLPYAPSGPGVAPIQYANEQWGDLVGEVVQVSGYGQTSSQSSTSDDLMKVRLAVITNQNCQQYFQQQITATIMCAQYYEQYPQSACQGDSGGPLVAWSQQGTPTLVGTVSFGSQICDQGSPTAFTRVSSFSAWITQNIQNDNGGL